MGFEDRRGQGLCPREPQGESSAALPGSHAHGLTGAHMSIPSLAPDQAEQDRVSLGQWQQGSLVVRLVSAALRRHAPQATPLPMTGVSGHSGFYWWGPSRDAFHTRFPIV